MLPLQIVLHNDGAEKVPDRYYREGIHYVTLANNDWQQVVWEIEPLARDRVTRLEIGYWVNKMLAAPSDRVAFEIGRVELQRVDAGSPHRMERGAGARSPSATPATSRRIRRPRSPAVATPRTFRFSA